MSFKFVLIRTYLSHFIKHHRNISTSVTLYKNPHDAKNTALMTREILDIALDKSQLQHLKHEETLRFWTEAMGKFRTRDRFLTGHMTFITTSLDSMHEFNLVSSLDAYNVLLDCFPKDKYVTRSLLEYAMPWPFPAVDLALKILTRMEEEGVRPDDLTYTILIEIFGRGGLPIEKCIRLAYWMDRFKDHDPYRLTGELPVKNPLSLFEMACSRMFGEDYSSRMITVHMEDSNNDYQYIYDFTNEPFREARNNFDPIKHDLIVEGPYLMWLQKHKEVYFTVRELIKLTEIREDEGTLLGICITGSKCSGSLKYWIDCLIRGHSNLATANVVYSIRDEDSTKFLIEHPNYDVKTE